MQKTLSKLLPAALCLALGGLMAVPAMAQSDDAAPQATEVWTAELAALNSTVTGRVATGEARLEVQGDDLVITVNITGVPSGIVHWQHFHGFTDGQPASCATQADDANGDDIVDLIETEKASGTTMVPFDTAPAAMDVAHGSYPQASEDGSYSYRQTVPLKDLQAAFGKAFDGQDLQLDHRVIYIHGVPADTELPASVASLGPIPASTTLPIACGKIEKLSTN